MAMEPDEILMPTDVYTRDVTPRDTELFDQIQERVEQELQVQVEQAPPMAVFTAGVIGGALGAMLFRGGALPTALLIGGGLWAYSELSKPRGLHKAPTQPSPSPSQPQQERQQEKLVIPPHRVLK